MPSAIPSQEPAIQEQGFRTALFGGFDKDDVLAYMNALANESQQRELEYQNQIEQLEAQVDKLKKEQSAARVCVDKLQTELQQANARAEAAESAGAAAAAKQSAAEAKQADAENRAATYLSRQKELQQSSLEWQFRCRDLQKQVDEMEAMIPKGGMPAPAAPQPKPEPAPAPAAPATPEPAQTPKPARPEPAEPAPAAPPVTEQARIEARKILADARLSAENAEQRLKRQEEEQKNRMADHARDLSAGVLLLKERLARVDEKLSSASLDLENATAAIYTALDQTGADLESLGGRLRAFGDEHAAPPAPAPAPQPAGSNRLNVPPQPVSRRVRPVRPQPARQTPPPAPVKRLRRAPYDSRPVSEELGDAIDRLDRDGKKPDAR